MRSNVQLVTLGKKKKTCMRFSIDVNEILPVLEILNSSKSLTFSEEPMLATKIFTKFCVFIN